MPSPRTFPLKYPGWFEKRQDVRRKLDRINNGVWKSEEEQLDYLRTVFGAVGEDLYFLEPVSFVNGKNIFIGDNVIIGSNSVANKDIPSNTVASDPPPVRIAPSRTTRAMRPAPSPAPSTPGTIGAKIRRPPALEGIS